VQCASSSQDHRSSQRLQHVGAHELPFELKLVSELHETVGNTGNFPVYFVPSVAFLLQLGQAVSTGHADRQTDRRGANAAS